MNERPIHLRGANVGLVAGIVLALVVAIGGSLGPGRSLLAERRLALVHAEEQLEAWLNEQQTTRPASAGEREGWGPAWQRLLARVPVGANDSEMIARLASAFEAPGVRRMQIQKTATQGDEIAVDADSSLLSPLGEDAISITRIPVSVTFVSLYGDAAAILSRLETRTLPVRVEAIDIRRDYPDVEVRLELTYFARVNPEES